MKSLLSLIFIFLVTSPAWAKRVTYMAPITSNFIVAGFDRLSSPARFCEVDFGIREVLFKSSQTGNLRTSGGFTEVSVSLRNIASTPQTVTVFIEEVYFDSCYWKATGVGAPEACYKKYFNNAGNGYQVKFDLKAKQTVSHNLQFGCQGNNTNNNCYLYQYPLMVDGAAVQAAVMHFNIPALFNAGATAAREFLCYKVSTQLNIRLEVAEDKGAIVGNISTDKIGPLGEGYEQRMSGVTDFRINGGRPF